MTRLLLRHRLRVRFRDCDPLGHVNNAVYLTYLEAGALHAVASADRRSSRAPTSAGRRGEGFILARAEIDFRAQVRYGDELEVRLALAAFGRTSATYDYELVDVKSDATVADGENRAGVVRLRRPETGAAQRRHEAEAVGAGVKATGSREFTYRS